MPTYRAKVDASGKIALPAVLRRRLHITEGTPVEFFLTLDGQVHFHAITGTTSGFGGLKFERREPPISIREMDDGIGEAVVEDFERIARQDRKSRRSPRLSRPAAE